MGRKRRMPPSRDPEGLPSDLEDEVDAFASAKDKVALTLEEGIGEEELSDDEEEAVLDIEEDSSEGSEAGSEELEEGLGDEEEDGDESELEDLDLEELERDIQLGGQIGELAKQAKAVRELLMKQKKAHDSEDSSESDDAGDDKAGGLMQWGAAEQYHGTADGKEADIDEQVLEEEEAEVLKLQTHQLRSMTEDDFGIREISSAEDVSGDEQGMADNGVEVELVPKDPDSISNSQKLAEVAKQAPELMSLCMDLKESLTEFRQKIGPLVKEGKPVKDHPVILRLIEIRAYLEKIRPIDARLQYQVDKLLRAAQIAKSAASTGELQGEDGLQFAPRPDALIDGDTQDLGDESALYKAPRLNPVAMEEDKDASNERQRKRDERKRAAQSELVNEMVEELTGAPEELHDRVPGWDTAKAIRALKKMENRSKIEEEMMTRVHLTKEEKKRLKAHKHKAGMSGGAALADFADDVRDTLGAIDNARPSQHFATNTIPQKVRSKSGDGDLPPGESFWERKKRLQELEAKKWAAKGRSHPFDGDNESVLAAKQLKQQKKAQKKAEKDAERLKRQQTKPPSAPPTVEGPRAISADIQKNRGLTPNRRRDIKNPRKRQRLRYESAQKKRQGMVQNIRTPDDVYGGEATGIKKNVSKSVRFK